MSSPTPGSTLAGADVTFVWSANGATIDSYELDIGTQGDATAYYNGSSTTATSASVTGLPTDGSALVATFKYTPNGGSEQTITYNYIAYAPAPGVPAITTPTDGATVSTGSDITIQWSANGSPQDFYILAAGTSPGATNVFYGIIRDTTSQLITVPSTEGTLYVGLQWPGGSDAVSYTMQDVPTPSMSSPTPGSTLAGADVTFFWSANGATIDSYELDIGTQGNATAYYNGSSTTATSASVTGLPTDGSALVATFKYTPNGGSEQTITYNYIAYAPAPGVPAITTPTDGATVSTGSDITIQWSANGSPQDFYILAAGTSPGATNVFYGIIRDTTSQLITVPSTEGTLYVRLQWPGGSDAVSYTMQDVPTPSMSSPTPGSTLAGADVTFVWSANGATIDSYELDIGTQGNATAYYNGSSTTATSASVTGLPTDGSALVATFKYTPNGGSEQTITYNYIAYAPAPGVPAITTPTDGATVSTGSDITIQWSANGSPQDFYILAAGTSPGATNVFYGIIRDTTSQLITVPSTEGTLYVRLQWPGGSDAVSYTMQDVPTPSMSSPTPGSTLAGADVTFVWSANGATIDSYELDIGTQGNATAYYNGSSTTATSASVTGLPTDGSALVATFKYTPNGGSEQTITYNYIAYAPAPGVPAITTPTDGATVSTGSDITIQWSANGSPQDFYILAAGTSPGATNVFYGIIRDTTSQLITVPSTEGTLYLRLQWPGGSDAVSYTMQDVPTPSMSSPTPGSTLAGADVTFVWSANGATIDSYELDIGTQGNATAYYNGSSTTATSASVTGLPTDGSALVATFKYTPNGGSEQTITYNYIAYAPAPGVPAVTSPTDGGNVSRGSDLTINWSENGSSQVFYLLYVGTSPGATDVYFGRTEGNEFSRTIIMPNHLGTIYIKLVWPGGEDSISCTLVDGG
jgi:hypothetical protein